jgi:hypothetical protein
VSEQHATGARDPLVAVISATLGEELSTGDLVHGLQQRRLAALARLLYYRIATALDAASARRCRELLERLCEPALDRVLRSPALCQLLRADPNAGGLHALLSNEMAAQLGTRSESWSALGDEWLGRRAPPGAASLQLHDGRLRAPRLACGLPLDLSLPAAVPRPSAGLRAPRVLAREESLRAIELCDRAVERLRTVYPLGHAAFCELKSNLVLRAEDARAAECWGATSSFAIGRLVLVNPAAAGGSRLLAEHLLHETTHAALACAELTCPLLRPSARSLSTRVASPWTGNPLTPHTFLHACAVWAVLSEYWARQHVAEDRRGRQAFVRRGFARLDARATLAPYRQDLTDGAHRLLAYVHACARDRAA